MNAASTRPIRVLTLSGPVPVTICELCACLVLALDGGVAAHERHHAAVLRGPDDRPVGPSQ